MQNLTRIVITAGMDGDEYAGIEAARILRKKYRTHRDIRVLPLINRAGYDNGTSYSPVDGLYPKLVFPGKPDGTDTEMRMHELYETHIRAADLWIDLHGGSTTEVMTPFVWMYQSAHPHIRAIHERFAQTTRAPIIVYDRNPFMTYSKFLDRQGIAHILMECGDLGKRRTKDIETLVRWVDDFLSPGTGRHRPTVYTSVRYQFTASDSTVRNGHLLWKTVDPAYNNGDLYAAYALP